MRGAPGVCWCRQGRRPRSARRQQACAVEASVTERRPWYEPMEKPPQEPVINAAMLGEFDTLVVEMPVKRNALPPGVQPLLSRPNRQTDAS